MTPFADQNGTAIGKSVESFFVIFQPGAMSIAQVATEENKFSTCGFIETILPLFHICSFKEE
jgi:hypothetical protein